MQQLLEEEEEVVSSELADWDERFSLRTMTRTRLLEMAKEQGIQGVSRLRKAELVALLEAKQRGK